MGRRGFASIDRLPSGSWRIRWTVQGVKHHEVLPKTCKKRAVEQRAAEIQAQYGGDSYGRRIPTYAELWERDILPTIESGKDTTRAVYLSAWRKVCQTFGNVKVSEMVPAIVQDWLIDNPGSNKSCLIVLRKVSTRAAQLGYTPSDVLDVKMRITAEKRSKTIPADIDAYLAAVRGSIIEGAVLLMLGAGLRVGEALAVPLSAMDMEAHTVLVADQVGGVNGSLAGRTKTKESRRVASWGPDVAERLAELYEIALDRGDVYLSDDGFGHPVGKRNAQRWWGKLTADLPKVTLQSLRPTFATRMLDAGMSERETNIAMGHKSLSAVLQQYDRPTEVVAVPSLYTKEVVS